MIRQSQRKHEKKVSPFINKLYEILEDQDNNQEAFVIFEPHRFSTTVLPKYFRHRKYSSFLRQLSFYNFTKKRCSNQAQNAYHHPLFRRTEPQKLCLIKRIDQKQKQKTQQKCPQQLYLHQDDQFSKSQSQKTYCLEQQFQKLKLRQLRLKQHCQSMLKQNKQIIFDNYILKATIQDESSSNKVILDRIQNFLMNYSSDYNINYCDFNVVKALLNFVEKKDWELLLEEKPREIMNYIMGLIEDNDIFVLLNFMTSAIPSERKKKKSYTIIKRQRQKQAQNCLKIQKQQYFQCNFNKNEDLFMDQQILEFQ